MSTRGQPQAGIDGAALPDGDQRVLARLRHEPASLRGCNPHLLLAAIKTNGRLVKPPTARCWNEMGMVIS
jgi:hypothetical protein